MRRGEPIARPTSYSSRSNAVGERPLSRGWFRTTEYSPLTPTIAEFVSKYIAGRTDMMPNTLKGLRTAERVFVTHVGPDKRLSDFTKADARSWLVSLKARFAPATAGRLFTWGSQFLGGAVEAEILIRNPFKGIKSPGQTNKGRQHFVDAATARLVIEAGTDASWRLVIALSRFGGLRIPSELVPLTWADILWDKNKVRVRSPKTERHDGKPERWIPLFPELEPYLEEAFDAAPEGVARIFPEINEESNLGQRLSRTVQAAGVSEWPRLFHGMRASRQTELSALYPIADVCAWMGNSPRVASDRYLMPLSSSFEKAIERGASDSALPDASGANATQNPTHNTTQTPDDSERVNELGEPVANQ